MDSTEYGQYLTRSAGLRELAIKAYVIAITNAEKDMGMGTDSLYKITSVSILNQMKERLKAATKFTARSKKKQEDILLAMDQLVNFAEFRKQAV